MQAEPPGFVYDYHDRLRGKIEQQVGNCTPNVLDAI